LDAARQKRTELTYDPALLLHAEEIEQLHERRLRVRDERADLPKRRAELATAEAELRRFAADLEWENADLDALIARIPARAKVAEVRTLLSQRGERFTAVTAAKEAVEEERRRLNTLRQQADALGPLVDVSTLVAVTETTRDLGDIAGRIREVESTIEEVDSDLRRDLGVLNPPVAEVGLLADVALPPRDSVQIHRDRHRKLEQRLQEHDQQLRAAEQELHRRQRAFERLTRDEEAVAPEELRQSRIQRDGAWDLIRRRFVEGVPLPGDVVRPFADSEDDLPDVYERAVAAADDLADRRFDKAEAAAQLAVVCTTLQNKRRCWRNCTRKSQRLRRSADPSIASGGRCGPPHRFHRRSPTPCWSGWQCARRSSPRQDGGRGPNVNSNPCAARRGRPKGASSVRSPRWANGRRSWWRNPSRWCVKWRKPFCGSTTEKSRPDASTMRRLAK